MNQLYKITNQINKKVYIGLTTQGVDRRWSEHVYRFNSGERDHKLYLAMRKYGIENFKMETILTVRFPETLPVLEVAYIKKYNSFNRGYNMTIGGDFVSDATREKLSKIMTGRKITWGDKIVQTKNERYSIWPCGRATGAENKQSKWFEVKHPDEHKEVFCGLREFCRKHDLSHNLLLTTLSGKQTHHKGYVLLATFNDYPYGEYTQAGGNGEYPVALAGQ